MAPANATDAYGNESLQMVPKSVLVDAEKPYDDWRGVPALADWALDGVVLSADEPGSSLAFGERDAKLFNIAVQGPALTNNGFLDDAGRPTVGRQDKMEFARGPAGESGLHFLSSQMFSRRLMVGEVRSPARPRAGSR